MYCATKNPNLRILGSTHFFPASAPHVPRWAQDAYAWCDCLVFESDLNAFRPYLTAEDDVALSTKLSPAIYGARSYIPEAACFLAALKPYEPSPQKP
jgi:hypothetical protein